MYNFSTIHSASFSSLNMLESSPKLFRAVKDGDIEIMNKGLFLGDAVHVYILTPELFEGKFKIASVKAPESDMMKSFIYYKVKFEAEGMDSKEASQKAYELSGYKIGAEKVFTYFNGKANQEYYILLSSTKDKIILAKEDFAKCKACAESIKDHKAANELIHKAEALYEYKIAFTYKKHLMVGILDVLHIDKINKVITITDLKTTGKDPKSFKDSYKSYKYYRQVAIYKKAVEWYMKNILKEDGYKIDVRFVVVGTTSPHDCRVFKPTIKDMEKGMKEVDDLLEKHEWHIENWIWDYDKTYYESDGIEIVSLDDVQQNN